MTNTDFVIGDVVRIDGSHLKSHNLTGIIVPHLSGEECIHLRRILTPISTMYFTIYKVHIQKVPSGATERLLSNGQAYDLFMSDDLELASELETLLMNIDIDERTEDECIP